MSKEFENDKLLQQLRKAAGKSKAPKLSEDLLYSATRTSEKFGSRRWHTPKLIVNLVGGAAILIGVFALASNPAQHRTYMTPAGELSKDTNQKLPQDSMRASLAMGDTKFTEEQLTAVQSNSLAEFGQKAVGNYVSNFPKSFSEKVWSGQSAAQWVFVVTDKIYIPNLGDTDFIKFFEAQEMAESRDQLNSDSSLPDIKLLIQGEDSVLYPLVIPANPENPYYIKVRDFLLNQTFTEVPTN